MNTRDSIYAIRTGAILLRNIRMIDQAIFDKIMDSPIEGCSCGYIKKGDDKLCPKCELPQIISKKEPKATQEKK